jgi:hypothetical protein
LQRPLTEAHPLVSIGGVIKNKKIKRVAGFHFGCHSHHFPKGLSLSGTSVPYDVVTTNSVQVFNLIQVMQYQPEQQIKKLSKF